MADAATGGLRCGPGEATGADEPRADRTALDLLDGTAIWADRLAQPPAASLVGCAAFAAAAFLFSGSLRLEADAALTGRLDDRPAAFRARADQLWQRVHQRGLAVSERPRS